MPSSRSTAGSAGPRCGPAPALPRPTGTSPPGCRRAGADRGCSLSRAGWPSPPGYPGLRGGRTSSKAPLVRGYSAHAHPEDGVATDLTVILEDRPGELARLGEATGDAGVNILGMCALTGEGKGYIHILVDDKAAETARGALEDADMGVADRREALVVDIEDRPGTLGDTARTLADASVNIELAYTTFGGVKLVVVTDDLDSARAALA